MTGRLVTIPEAARILSVPSGTLYSWASRGAIVPALVARGGQKLYSLAQIRDVAGTTRRRNRDDA